jgi:hypothetical protein
MTTSAVARIVVASAVAAVLGAGVLAPYHPRTGTVRAAGEVVRPDPPPGHPIDTEPACPNCYI